MQKSGIDDQRVFLSRQRILPVAKIDCVMKRRNIEFLDSLIHVKLI